MLRQRRQSYASQPTTGLVGKAAFKHIGPREFTQASGGEFTGIRPAGFIEQERLIRSSSPYQYQPLLRRRRQNRFSAATLSIQGPFEKRSLIRFRSKNQRIANAKMKIRTKLLSTPRLQHALENMPVGAGRLRVNLLY